MNRRTRKMLSVLIPSMAIILACSCPPTGNGAKTPTPPPPPNVLFEDDFDNPNSGWEVGDYDTGSVGYKDGVYSVTSLEKEWIMWGVANKSFDNVVIEVAAAQISAGPDDNNAYGIVCREQGTGEGYYLRISGDGFYSIGRAEGETVVPLLESEWVQSDDIRKGNATNHIRAICDGSTLALFVNGQRLATVEDTTFTSGDIALTVTTFEDEPSEIHFDNLVVRKP